jgi:hypothetical protein
LLRSSVFHFFAKPPGRVGCLFQLIDVICKLLTEPIREATPPNPNSRPPVDRIAHAPFDLIPQAWVQMPLQMVIMHLLKDLKELSMAAMKRWRSPASRDSKSWIPRFHSSARCGFCASCPSQRLKALTEASRAALALVRISLAK